METPEDKPEPATAEILLEQDNSNADGHELPLWVTDRHAAVRLRIGSEGLAAEPPTTIPQVFHDTAQRFPDRCALAVKEKSSSEWKTWTFKEYLRDVEQAAKGFIRLGLEPVNGVGIIGFNAPQWFIAHLGSIFAGGLATGIYTTNSSESVSYILEHSKANIVVVEDTVQLKKVLAAKDGLPDLKAIIQYSGQVEKPEENIYTWEEFMKLGDEVTDKDLEERTKLSQPNKCCALIYTSGTTGTPKGCMLSHDNVIWTAKSVFVSTKSGFGEEVIISYLPLSHVGAQMNDIIAPVVGGTTTYFAQPDALKGSLGTTLKEVRPTIFFGVPRVWEKMAEKLREVGQQTTGCRKILSEWAKGVCLGGQLAKMKKERPPLSYGIASWMMQRVAIALGLDRCRLIYSAAAPISKDLLQYFMSLDITLIELYGMSENTGPQHMATPWDFTIGSVGPALTGVRTVLRNEDQEGNGEICMDGRTIFMGYLDNEEKTRETIDDEGLLHTGDMGKFDETGRYLFITGRFKELIITAGGENVAPVPIEDKVKRELPIISNAMLIGDKRKFISILLTLKTEVNLDTLVPSNKLTKEAVEWAKSIGSSATTVSDVINNTDKQVMMAIQAGIDRANEKSVSRAQKIQKWSLLPVDFSVPGGELGPSLKLKRHHVLKMYAQTIDAFYQEG